jgi:hypothetical protein
VVGIQTGGFIRRKAGCACGSMVRFQSFWKKDVRFRPAGGEILRRVNDRVTRGM